MRTLRATNNHTKVDLDLQADLAAFGIVRKTVMENAPPSDEPNFFGIRRYGDKTELRFDTDIATLQDENMQVAIAAPDNETFNMLVTTNFSKAVTTASKDDLRTFVRNIFDKA